MLVLTSLTHILNQLHVMICSHGAQIPISTMNITIVSSPWPQCLHVCSGAGYYQFIYIYIYIYKTSHAAPLQIVGHTRHGASSFSNALHCSCSYCSLCMRGFATAHKLFSQHVVCTYLGCMPWPIGRRICRACLRGAQCGAYPQ